MAKYPLRLKHKEVLQLKDTLLKFSQKWHDILAISIKNAGVYVESQWHRHKPILISRIKRSLKKVQTYCIVTTIIWVFDLHTSSIQIRSWYCFIFEAMFFSLRWQACIYDWSSWISRWLTTVSDADFVCLSKHILIN